MKRGAVVAIVAVSVAAVLGAGAAGTVLFVPEVRGFVFGSTADGSDVFTLTGAQEELPVADLTPPSGWWVQPHGAGGFLLYTPDRRLTVTFLPASTQDADRALDAATASGALVFRETLASDLPVRHVTDGSRLVAVVETSGGPVLVEASAADGADLADYRPAFAGLLEALSER